MRKITQPISENEAQSMLGGLSTETLRRMRKSGKLLYSKVGYKTVVYDRAQILDYLNSRRYV